MTRPVYEPNTARDESTLDFAADQLERRPAPAEAGAANAQWIRIKNNGTVSVAPNTLVNTLQTSVSVSWDQSDDINGAFEIDAGNLISGQYVIKINEPGVYSCHNIGSIAPTIALMRGRANIESAVLQETVGGNQRYGYAEFTSALGGFIHVWDSIIVTQNDIDESEVVDVNYIRPRVRQEAAVSLNCSISFVIWRLPIPGPAS